MLKRKHSAHEEGGIESWLMSYADMITLLLSFFIIFVSTSEPKQDKLAAATKGMQAQFGSVDLATPFNGSLRALQGVIDANQAYQTVSAERTPRGLQIELSTSTYFQPHQAELAPARLAMLSELVEALKGGEFTDYTVTIEGHTDNTPPVSGLYTSNWELSAARATRLVRFFIEKGFDPVILRAEAYGEMQPKVPNLDANGEPIPANQERNRRVVIKLERRL